MGYIGKKPTPVPLTSSDVTDGIISNAKLAQDVISAETALTSAPADTDEFLLSDAGTLKRIDYSLIKSDPTHVLLSTTNISSAVSVTISSNIDSTYKVYMIELINIHANNDDISFQMRFLQGGTEDSGSIYDYAYGRAIDGQGSIPIVQAQNSNHILLSETVDNDDASSLSGKIYLYNPSRRQVLLIFQNPWVL